MSNSFKKEKKYYDILNLIRKNVSYIEPFLIIIKENFTNNIFYYFLCVIFRFSHILLFACDYSSVFLKSNNTQITVNLMEAENFALDNDIYDYYISCKTKSNIESIHKIMEDLNEVKYIDKEENTQEDSVVVGSTQPSGSCEII